MFKTTVDVAHNAASVLFNLPEYRVVAVVRDDQGRREVFVETPVVEAGCPSCGVLSSRVHQRSRQRVRDVGFDGLVGAQPRCRSALVIFRAEARTANGGGAIRMRSGTVGS